RQLPFHGVAELLSGMRVPPGLPSGNEFRARHDRVPALGAEVLVLQHSAREAGLLRIEQADSGPQRGGGEGRCYRQFPHAWFLLLSVVKKNQARANRSVPSFSMVVVSRSPGLSHTCFSLG